MYEAVSLKQVFTPDEVDEAIKEMAGVLNHHFAGKQVVVMPVMNGALVFAGKLLPLLTFEVRVVSVQVARYKGSKGGTTSLLGQEPDAGGLPVLLLDEILDEGITLNFVKGCIVNTPEVFTCVLLEKKLYKDKPAKADLVGLHVEGWQFVVGTGMDMNGWCRNLPGIWEIKC